MMKRMPQIAALAALLNLTSAEALACAACFGQSDSAMARGMNMGIFALLLIVVCVLSGIAGFFVYLVHRNSQMAIAHEQIGADLTENRTNG